MTKLVQAVRTKVPRKRKTYWYISDFDSHTNEVISTLLPTVNCHSQALCQDGKKRDLWETDYLTITRLKKSKIESHLVFSVFKRDGLYGPVKKYDFPKKKLVAKIPVPKKK